MTDLGNAFLVLDGEYNILTYQSPTAAGTIRFMADLCCQSPNDRFDGVSLAISASGGGRTRVAAMLGLQLEVEKLIPRMMCKFRTVPVFADEQRPITPLSDSD